jgi:uncharacterized protein
MTVTHHPDRSRFETDHDDPAYLEYEERDEATLDLQHTIVPPHLEGKGIASDLVKSALEFARSNGLRVIPTCSYVRSWLSRHDEYEDLVA